jgi:hypothetical protein
MCYLPQQLPQAKERIQSLLYSGRLKSCSELLIQYEKAKNSYRFLMLGKVEATRNQRYALDNENECPNHNVNIMLFGQDVADFDSW